MKNAKILIPIILGVLVGGAGAGLFLWSKQEKPKAPTSTTALPTSVTLELAKWTDPAGFSFQHPKDISVNPHDEDKENYAHVELTQKDHPGRVIVWAKDLPAPDLAGWIKKEKRFMGASVLDTTLGGKLAKKILLAEPAKMIIVGTTDVDVLITVEGELVDSDYWSKIHQTMVDSFVFTGGSEKSSLPASGSDESSAEEEVIE